MSKSLIYVVEDEENIRNLLQFNLEKSGFRVRGFDNSRSFLKILSQQKPDLICLDIMLPDYDGVELCKRLRNLKIFLGPIIMLTAKTTEFDTIIGLESGADDYMAKPFSFNELLARIRALLRRKIRNLETVDTLEVAGIKIDFEKRTVSKDGITINMTFKEFELLKLLASNQGIVFSRETLLGKIWGYDYFGDTRTVDVHIHSLRKLIGEGFIKTVRGVGYKFISEEK